MAKNSTAVGKSKVWKRDGLMRKKDEPSCVGTGTRTERVIRFASAYVAAPSPQSFRGEASEDYGEVAATHSFPVTHDGFVWKHHLSSASSFRLYLEQGLCQKRNYPESVLLNSDLGEMNHPIWQFSVILTDTFRRFCIKRHKLFGGEEGKKTRFGKREFMIVNLVPIWRWRVQSFEHRPCAVKQQSLIIFQTQ